MVVRQARQVSGCSAQPFPSCRRLDGLQQMHHAGKEILATNPGAGYAWDHEHLRGPPRRYRISENIKKGRCVLDPSPRNASFSHFSRGTGLSSSSRAKPYAKQGPKTLNKDLRHDAIHGFRLRHPIRPPNSGNRRHLHQLLQQDSKRRPVPDDVCEQWCLLYVIMSYRVYSYTRH